MGRICDEADDAPVLGDTQSVGPAVLVLLVFKDFLDRDALAGGDVARERDDAKGTGTKLFDDK